MAVIERYGVTFHDGTQVVSLIETPDSGWTFLVRGKRQEVEMRVTPSGLLRVGRIRKSGQVTAKGVVEPSAPLVSPQGEE